MPCISKILRNVFHWNPRVNSPSTPERNALAKEIDEMETEPAPTYSMC
jgi:hypothetical protein